MPSDYDRVARAIRFLDENFQDQPRLADAARAIGMSEFHFQRLFRRWAGISPKRFLQLVTAEFVRSRLDARGDMLDATLDAGLSGAGRLHDLTVNVYAATPMQLRDGGRGLEIRFGLADSPLGRVLVGQTSRGLCDLQFVDGSSAAAAIAALRKRWPLAAMMRDDVNAQRVVRLAFRNSVGRGQPSRLMLELKGTNFQIRVWEALLRIPSGSVATYSDIAAAVGAPSATRAVGTAVGQNPIALLIPCHRVLRETGALGGYRWGLERKRLLLGWEAARAANANAAAVAGA